MIIEVPQCVAETIRGTLTLSGSASVHTPTFTILLCELCTTTVSAYSGPSYIENYARIVAFEPDLHRASFHGVTDLLPHSRSAW